MTDRGIDYEAAGKKLTLYLSDKAGSPLIIFNNYSDDGGSIVKAMKEISCADCSLLSIGNLVWNNDMTPWSAPSFIPGEKPYTGGADEYLNVLLNEIIQETERKLSEKPEFTGIAGYSLAGLFSIYSMYKCDRFERVASMSGSLWFPEFTEYVLGHSMTCEPSKIYLSLGNKEAKTRNPVLKPVQENTEKIFEHYQKLGLNISYELNEGNHFKDAAMRSAKGIAAILIA